MRKKSTLAQPSELTRNLGTDNDLPEGWAVVLARDVIELKYGKALKAEDRVIGKISVYGSNGLVGNHNSALSKGETVVIGRKGSVGMVHYSPESCWPIDTTYYIDDFCDFFPKYLAYYLSSLSLSTLDTSTAVPGLNRNDAYAKSLLLPPLAEQQRIVAKVDALLSRRNAAVEHLERAKKLIKAFRQSALVAACSGLLTESWRQENPREHYISVKNQFSEIEPLCQVPDNWQWVSLGSLCDAHRGISYGVIKLGATEENGVPCLRTSNVKWLDIDVTGVKKINKALSEQYRRTILRAGDVLVNVRGTLGGVATVSPSMTGWNVSREVAVIPTQNVDSHYVAKWIATLYAQNWLLGEARGVAYTGINLEDLRKLPVPLPPLLEQIEINRRADELLACSDAIEQRISNCEMRMNQISSSILNKAFHGKLVSTEADLVRAAMSNVSDLSRVITSEIPADEVDALFYPHTDADRAVCSVACAILEQAPTLPSMDHLDAVLLATHPKICRIFLNTAERHAFDKARKAVQQAVFLADDVSVNWQKCRNHLEENGYISVDHVTSGQPITRTTASTATFVPSVAAVNEMARFALMALEQLQKARHPSARVSQERRSAVVFMQQQRLVEVA